jgi:acylphosphatase
LATEQFIIAGNLAAENFLPWVERHMRRLGLQGAPVRRADGQVEIILSGPPDLIDAMELGVSLGPIEVWVDSIDRRTLDNAPRG